MPGLVARSAPLGRAWVATALGAPRGSGLSLRVALRGERAPRRRPPRAWRKTRRIDELFCSPGRSVAAVIGGEQKWRYPQPSRVTRRGTRRGARCPPRRVGHGPGAERLSAWLPTTASGGRRRHRPAVFEKRGSL